MSGDGDDFRIRPGKGRSRGSGRSPGLAAQVRRAAARAGFARGPLRRGGGTGRLGRGQGAALAARRSSAMRRVVIKARIVRHAGERFRAAPLARHVAYLERDGVTRDGRDAAMFDRESDIADGEGFARRCGDDRHHFRFLVSPEDAGELADLRGFTRELMDDVARDLGTRLDWIAVDHWNTGHPHVHVLVRGIAEDGTDLVIDRGYIASGMRARAQARLTLELGPRSAREIEQALAREVTAGRWTGLDRALAGRAQADGLVDLRPEPSCLQSRRDTLMIARAQHLEELGFATPTGPGQWVLGAGLETRLRDLGETGDIIATIHRAMREAGESVSSERLSLHPAAAPGAVIGRLVERGLHDELAGSAYAIVEGVDGRLHHLRFADLELTGDAHPGAIVELRSWEAAGKSRAVLAVRSDLPLERQVHAGGATWLDRQLLANRDSLARSGFGAAVRDAMAAREDHLVSQGLAHRRGGQVSLTPGLIERLRAHELRGAAARIAARTGLAPRASTPGSRIAGTYRERIALASGRFAMVEDGLGFQLVPWRPALDRQLGQQVTGSINMNGGVEWTVGRGRGLAR